MTRRALVLAICLSFASISPLVAQDAEAAEGEEAPISGVAAMRRDADMDAEAQSRFRIAQTLYEEGRFLDAAREFEGSYELSQRPSLLFNAYLAYRDAGQLADAVRCLDGYLTREENPQDEERLTDRLQAMRATLEAQQARQQLEEAEAQRLAAEAAAAREQSEIARQQNELAQQQAASAQREADAARAGANRRRVTGFAVGAVGAAAVIGGVVTGVLASGRFSDIEDNCRDNLCPTNFDLESARSETKTLQLTTDILIIAGGVALVTGVVLLLTAPSNDDDEEPSAALTPSASCGPSGCMASLSGDF